MEIIGLIVLAWFIWQVLKAISNVKRSKSNNGAEIRYICNKYGVPANEYNRIVLNRMDEAKDLAVRLSVTDNEFKDAPWNIRLAVAICLIYLSEVDLNQKRGVAVVGNTKINDPITIDTNSISATLKDRLVQNTEANPPLNDMPEKGIFSKSLSTTWWWTKLLLFLFVVQLGILWLPFFSNDYNSEYTRDLVKKTVETLVGSGGAIVLIISCVFFLSFIINLISAPFKKQ